MPLVSPLAPKSCQDLPPVVDPKFDSKVSYEMATSGMTLRTVLQPQKPPPGLVFLPKPKTARGNGAPPPPLGGGGDGGGEDDQTPPTTPFGFVTRYWYILAPVVLMNFMGGNQGAATDEQQGEEGQAPAVSSASAGAYAGAGAGAVAATAAATSATSSATKSRRGKRG
jgi:hypothetical protein